MALKILLVSEYFFPKSTGGTELYVYNLAKALVEFGHDVNILTCADEVLNYEFNGLTVFTIPFNHNQSTDVISGKLAADNVGEYIKNIEEIKADIIHFHTLTTSIGAFHMEASKRLNFKVLLTSHIPGHICLKGDLFRLNREVCDGIIESQKCLSCSHQDRGIVQPFNQLSAATLKFSGYIFPYSDAAKTKKKLLLKLSQLLDAIVVVSAWQKQMFLANGVNDLKLHVCRQAIFKFGDQPKRANNTIFTIGFTGRISSGKGLHLLLDALESIDPSSFCLKVTAIAIPDEIPYFEEMKVRIKKLKNHVWIENLPNEQIGAFMSSLDILCIPSIWLETGPFVAYEAMGNGIPVLGSNSGGIKELVTEGENGWLFEFNNTLALTEKILEIIAIFKINHSLPFKSEAIRTSYDMANEMITIYKQLST